MNYPINVVRDTNGSLLITFPDIPEANSVAYGNEEILQNATDALESAFDIYVAEQRAIPLPSAARNDQLRVTLTAASAARIVRWNETLAHALSKTGLTSK